ncbi:linoleate 13S-lipoxygenase 2-1, chloroplastic-like [Impatiens glandulifera]|uniref:linoleate 13S-lipoxygenase 2-1, chloroplastic-like n=1 Tax=Impatiens glandulifera TaxID=253017 RepID=UPI001FB0EBD2|nr:linoleate 13S-lipoxygenase 2-1, chloroplastic-like [Impatiens glandulifera]
MRRKEGSQLIQIVHRPLSQRTGEELNTDNNQEVIASPEADQNLMKNNVITVCFPSQQHATTVMAVLDVLSNHSVDEEYIGEKIEPSWEEEGVIKAAFERYSRRVKEIEGIIDARNLDLSLKHRSGAGEGLLSG